MNEKYHSENIESILSFMNNFLFKFKVNGDRVNFKVQNK